MRLTIGELLTSSARRSPHKEAIVFKDKRLDYKTLNERANRLGNMLLSLGMKKGDRCAILFYNRGEWAEVYFGLAKAGIIAVPVNFRFTAQEVEYILSNSEAKVLIYEELFEPIVNKLRTNIKSVEHYVCLGQASVCSLSYHDLLMQASNLSPEIVVRETDPFFIGYTSGTTGFPKGALVLHRNLIEHLVVTSKIWGDLIHSDRVLLIMPVFHSNSAWFLQIMIMLGGTLVILHSGGFNSEEVIRIIDEEKITFTSVVPTMLSMFLKLPDDIKSRYDISSMKRLMVSSAPILTKTKNETLDYFKGVQLFEGYGSTETGGVTVLRPEEQTLKVRSIGIPAMGKEVRLLDEHGNDVQQGEIGELYAKGFGILLQEYWKNPQATAHAFRGEWCTVGDMARMDEEGYLYLEDRKSDMIISGGENVYPTEVEDILVKHPAVFEVAVVGIPDDHWGEKVHAAIVTNDGFDVSIEDVQNFCVDKLAGYKRPKSIEIVKELPKSPTGKILRRKVREPYWGQNMSLYL